MADDGNITVTTDNVRKELLHLRTEYDAPQERMRADSVRSEVLNNRILLLEALLSHADHYAKGTAPEPIPY